MTYLMQVYGVYHCWFNQHFDLCMILMGSARVGDALWPPPHPTREAPSPGGFHRDAPRFVSVAPVSSPSATCPTPFVRCVPRFTSSVYFVSSHPIYKWIFDP